MIWSLLGNRYWSNQSGVKGTESKKEKIAKKNSLIRTILISMQPIKYALLCWEETMVGKHFVNGSVWLVFKFVWPLLVFLERSIKLTRSWTKWSTSLSERACFATADWTDSATRWFCSISCLSLKTGLFANLWFFNVFSADFQVTERSQGPKCTEKSLMSIVRSVRKWRWLELTFSTWMAV